MSVINFYEKKQERKKKKRRFVIRRSLYVYIKFRNVFLSIYVSSNMTFRVGANWWKQEVGIFENGRKGQKKRFEVYFFWKSEKIWGWFSPKIGESCDQIFQNMRGGTLSQRAAPDNIVKLFLMLLFFVHQIDEVNLWSFIKCIE